MTLFKQTKKIPFKRKPLAVATLMALGISAPLLSVAQTASVNAPAANAATASQHAYNITAQPLENALIQLGRQSGLQVSVESALVSDKQGAIVQGTMTVAQAMDILLQGSELSYRVSGGLLTVVAAGDGVLMFDPVRVEGEAEARFGDTPAEPGGFVAEYQTTATKMAMSLKETPQAISVVTRESMDARQVKDIVSAVELTAGVNTGGAWGTAGPFAGRSKYGYQYKIRGQEVNYDSGIRSDGFAAGALSSIDLAAFERVEVVKGPSGFYGQGSLGGFINLVRKKPQEKFDASISAQVGSYDTYRTELDITGAINEGNNLRGRLVTAYEDAGAFTDGIESQTTLLAPSLEFMVGDNTRILTQLLYQNEEFDVNPGVPLKLERDQIKTYNLSRSYLFGAIGDEKSSTNILDTTLKIDHDLSDKWLASLLLQHNKTERDIIIGNYGYDYYKNLEIYAYANRDNTESVKWASELRIEGHYNAFDREHKLLIGAEVNEINNDRNNGFSPPLGVVNLYTGNFSDLGILRKNEIPINRKVGYEQEVKNTAVYIQTVLDLQERTQLLLGARYDWAKQKVNSDTTDLTKQSDKELTIRVGLTQELTNNISAYATYAESFTPVTNEGKDGILDPTTGEGYELGLKTDWFDNKFGGTLSVYRQELNNRPIRDADNPPYYVSAGLHRTDGIEVEVTGSPLSGLTLAVAATWMDNEFIDRKDVANYGLSNSGSIDNQYSLYANYELQEGVFKGLGVGATLISVGDRNFVSRRSQIYLDGYERADLNFSYQGFSKWDISLQIRNIFDKKYIENADSYLGNLSYYGSPRAVLLKAIYNF